jgi:hypothetical protein
MLTSSKLYFGDILWLGYINTCRYALIVSLFFTELHVRKYSKILCSNTSHDPSVFYTPEHKLGPEYHAEIIFNLIVLATMYSHLQIEWPEGLKVDNDVTEVDNWSISMRILVHTRIVLVSRSVLNFTDIEGIDGHH